MIAVTKTVTGEVRLTDRTIREVGPGHVRLAVSATGICGTDLHIAADEYASIPPVTMGHEISGTVVQTGKGVDESWLEQRVACETYFSACETCRMCRAGRRNLCVDRRSLGSFEDGGFAEYVVVPAINLHRIPDHISSEDAVLFEPLACVTQCLLERAGVKAGDRALVIGPGAMGLLSVQVALAAGARVTCVGLAADAHRLALAARMGATIATDVEPEAYDVVIECSGAAAGISTAFRAVCRAGRYIQVGISGRDVTIPFDTILFKELSVTSGFASTPNSWRRALDLVTHRQVDFSGLVTHKLPLEQWEEAFALINSADAIKVALCP
ncbi:alcohol dehydrogenase catalytic domain-containing protein [Arthrobacter sp. TB 23]|uniref:zinc-dependent alcohol dehydrogenase n=1 Tax=Arthrobacter sp. TB 23 TaxID=494419 RepID=UPI00037A503D